MNHILPASAAIVVGQRIYTNLYSRGYGTVVAIHGEQNPGSVRSALGIASGGRAQFDVVFDSGATAPRLSEAILRGVQWTVLAEVVDGAAVADAVVKSELFKAAETAKKEEAARAYAAAVEALRASPDYKHLQQLADKYDGKATAKNLRAHLKKHFPGVKFSVRMDGNSVRVRWQDGPTIAQVDPIADAFKGGSFDGMEDIYRRERSPFTDLFGSFSYVNTTRDKSDSLLAFAIGYAFQRWAEYLQGVERPTVEAMQGGALWHVRIPCIPGLWRADNLQSLIYTAADMVVTAGDGFAVLEATED